MPASAAGWTRDQLLLALRLYMRLPFGKLDHRNPDIIALAAKIGRTPSALAMKAVNFANIDPNLKRSGLSNASKADRNIWNEFFGDSTALALEAEEAAERFNLHEPIAATPIVLPTGDTDRESLVRVRRVQSFFRNAVMVSYDRRCAVTGLAVPDLLVASHIIPWSDSIPRPADPTNGLALNALLDRAFDRGLMSFDDQNRVIVAQGFAKTVRSAELPCSLLEIEGRPLKMPRRFRPDPAALAHYRAAVFRG